MHAGCLEVVAPHALLATQRAPAVGAALGDHVGRRERTLAAVADALSAVTTDTAHVGGRLSALLALEVHHGSSPSGISQSMGSARAALLR